MSLTFFGFFFANFPFLPIQEVPVNLKGDSKREPRSIRQRMYFLLYLFLYSPKKPFKPIVGQKLYALTASAEPRFHLDHILSQQQHKCYFLHKQCYTESMKMSHDKQYSVSICLTEGYIFSSWLKFLWLFIIPAKMMKEQCRKCEVIYNYTPHHQDELELVVGEVIEIIREVVCSMLFHKDHL